MEPSTPETTSFFRQARLWLALLLALLFAALPGSRPTDILAGQAYHHDHHLDVTGDVLTAIHGRDILVRAKTAPTFSLAATAIPPSASFPLPPRDVMPIRYRPLHHRSAGTCPLAPCARGPPILNMTA